MSWSFTVNADNMMTEIPPEMIAEWVRANPDYPADMQIALDTARRLGLSTFTCSGGRTYVPYNNDVYISVTVLGSPNLGRLNESIRETILRGPDDAAKAARDGAILHEDDRGRRVHNDNSATRRIQKSRT